MNYLSERHGPTLRADCDELRLSTEPCAAVAELAQSRPTYKLLVDDA
jgi:hypothetical protein